LFVKKDVKKHESETKNELYSSEFKSKSEKILDNHCLTPNETYEIQFCYVSNENNFHVRLNSSNVAYQQLCDNLNKIEANYLDNYDKLDSSSNAIFLAYHSNSWHRVKTLVDLKQGI
jgi:hypothetical protein